MRGVIAYLCTPRESVLVLVDAEEGALSARAQVTSDESTSVAEQLLHALSTFDAQALASVLPADAVAWRNVGDRTRTGAEVAATLTLERALIRSATIDVHHQSCTEDGFVVQFVFAGTTTGGRDFAVPICLVARVTAGRITRFDEYTDETSLQPLRAELLAHAPAGTTSEEKS